jgi:PTS system fructose-specific IIC component
MPGESDMDKKHSAKAWVEFYQAVLFGISRIIPLIVVGGLLISFSNIIGVQILHYTFSGDPAAGTSGPGYSVFSLFLGSGKLLLTLVLLLLSAFIAVSLGGNEAFVPGLAGGLLARGGEIGSVTVPVSGYIGALAAGALAGYFTRMLKKKMGRPDGKENYYRSFFLPLLSSAVVIPVMYFAIAPSIGALNTAFLHGLEWMQSHGLNLPAGIIIGAMSNFDFGGPVNKIAYMFSTNLWQQGDRVFYSAFTAAKIIPAFSIGISVVLFPGLFSESERGQALPAVLMSMFGGIGEGVIPYALRDPIPVIIPMMSGGALASALVLNAKIDISTGAGGSLLTVMLTSNPGLWFLFFAAGVALSTVMMIVMKKRMLKKREETG